MKLDPPYPTISKANRCNTFELSPPSNAKLLAQACNLTNRTAHSNSFLTPEISLIISKYTGRPKTITNQDQRSKSSNWVAASVLSSRYFTITGA